MVPRVPKVTTVPKVATVPAVRPGRKRTGGSRIQAALHGREVTLLDMVDSLIDRGALVNADVTLGLANVDLVYIRLSALIGAADRLLKESLPMDEPVPHKGKASRSRR